MLSLELHILELPEGTHKIGDILNAAKRIYKLNKQEDLKMECKQCGSKKEVSIFFDKHDCDVLCWNCLLESCGIEKRLVEKFVDVLTDFVFYDKDELIGYILEMEEVNIQSGRSCNILQ